MTAAFMLPIASRTAFAAQCSASTSQAAMSVLREGRLVVRDPGPTGDGRLDEALTLVGRRKASSPRVSWHVSGSRHGSGSTSASSGGVLRAEDYRVLGMLPMQRWPSNDAAHESSVRAGLGTALREGATTEARTGALISALLALNAVHKTVDTGSVGLSKADRRGRLQQRPSATATSWARETRS